MRPSLSMVARAVDVVEGKGWARGTVATSPMAMRTAPCSLTPADGDGDDDDDMARDSDSGSGSGSGDGDGDGVLSSSSSSPRPRLDVESLGKYGLALE